MFYIFFFSFWFFLRDVDVNDVYVDIQDDDVLFLEFVKKKKGNKGKKQMFKIFVLVYLLEMIVLNLDKGLVEVKDIC